MFQTKRGDFMYCQSCGQQNYDNTFKCVQCGNALHAQVAQQSGKAVASMIVSLIGFFFCLFIGQIIGLILGYSAKNEIRASQGRLTGEGFASAGIIIGWIGIVYDVFVLFVSIVFLIPFISSL
jgi:uncharacterized paraquat-inducible protein A